MKYKCIPCDHEFEVKNSIKPRCPRCMRIHDLESVTDTGIEKRDLRKWAAPIAILLVVGIVAVVQFSMRDDEKPKDKPETPQLSTIFEEYGIKKGEEKEPFAVTSQVETFAVEAAGNKSGSEGMQALFDAVLKLREKGRWKPYHQREPRDEKPLVADELLTRLKKGSDEPYLALSYELACLLLSAARAVDIDAKMAEIFQFEGEKKPADSGGKCGRFGVVLGEGGKDKSPPLFEPYSGRSLGSAKAKAYVMSDAEATAPYYGLSSLSLLTDRDTSGALKLNDIATKLAPNNPYYRTGRGLIFAASGAQGEAMAEFEKAAKQRGDAVSKTNLAEILILADPSGRRAEAEIQDVLSSMPDFSRAHAVLAMIQVMRREFDKAELELALAEKLDPASPVVAMFWAQFYASQLQSDEAIAKAKDAVRLSDESFSSLLGLAGIYKATARFDDMRKTLDKAFKLSKSTDMAEQIKVIFNYDPGAHDREDDNPMAGDENEGDGELGGLNLKLGGQDPELGAGQAPGLGGGSNKLKLGDGLGSGLGGGLNKGGGGLGGSLNKGGSGLGGGNLKLDLNLNKK